MRAPVLLTLIALCLSACGGEEPRAPEPSLDPVAHQALYDEITTDPDLVGQNLANAALGGTLDHSIPRIVDGADAREAARRAAIAIVGEQALSADLGRPARDATPIPASARTSVAGRAAMIAGLAPCARKATLTARWAARLPDAIPAFPRSNTLAAAGADGDDCDLRAVRFATPVAQGEVLAFYRALMLRAGLRPDYTLRDGEAVLGATRGARKAALFVHTDADGITRGDLILSGFGGGAAPGAA